jgi:EmrB/QacA subfamily drug resistance transporter
MSSIHSHSRSGYASVNGLDIALSRLARISASLDSRWLALLVLCAGFLLIVVDMTIVNVALPSIGRDLRFSPAGLAWVVNAYLIAFAGLLLLAGRLGDLFGRKRVFLIGLGIFTLASVACGLSFNQPILIAARFVQGIGGAVSSAVILAMIVTLFPEPDDRARAFGVFSFVASAGAAIGMLAGGLITQAVSWHWIFFVNLPIGVLTALLAGRLLRSDRGIGVGEGADVLGALLVTAALMLGVYAVVDSSSYGLGSPRTMALGALATGLLGAFVARQALGRNPILPMRLFHNRNLSGANLIQALMAAAFFGFFFLASLDMERVLGYGPLAIGLAFMPVAVVMGGFSLRFTAQLVMRFGPRPVVLAGQALIAVALALIGFGPLHADYLRDLFVPMALLGLGGGLSFPALTIIAMSDAPPSDSGLASGLLNTTGQMGGALGLAILATLAGGRTSQLIGEGNSTALALGSGYHLAWVVGAGVVVATLALAAVLLRSVPAVASEDFSEVEAAA